MSSKRGFTSIVIVLHFFSTNAMSTLFLGLTLQKLYGERISLYRRTPSMPKREGISQTKVQFLSIKALISARRLLVSGWSFVGTFGFSPPWRLQAIHNIFNHKSSSNLTCISAVLMCVKLTSHNSSTFRIAISDNV